MPYLEVEQIEIAARRLRKTLGVDDLLYLDPMTLIVKAKHFGLIGDYRRVPDHEMPDDEAIFDPHRKILIIRESAFCAMNRGEARARFTIAHELGHMALGHTNARNRNVSGRAIEKIAPTIKRDEAQANAFAAVFLAPTHLVRQLPDLSCSEIAKRFGLSEAAAEVRKSEVETVIRREQRTKRTLPNSITDYLNEAKTKGHRVKPIDGE